jgi:hypothetical protein
MTFERKDLLSVGHRAQLKFTSINSVPIDKIIEIANIFFSLLPADQMANYYQEWLD